MSDIVCCPLNSNDGCDAPSVSATKLRRAAKPHRCSECRETIVKGATYEYTSGRWDGSWSTFRTCLSCAEIRNHFQCDGWIYGELWPDLEENFFPDMKAGGPCMKGLSPEAKARLFERRSLTQPWCGLVASGIKRIENRPRPMIRVENFGEPFALHASREIDEDVYRRIFEIAPELQPEATRRWWYMLTRITSAVIGVATIDKAFTGGWDEESIARNADLISFSNGERLGPAQVRWFFGPTAYALRDDRALAEPVPCRGHQGFWTLSPDIESRVLAQLSVAP